jgi:hypothetical protein
VHINRDYSPPLVLVTVTEFHVLPRLLPGMRIDGFYDDPEEEQLDEMRPSLLCRLGAFLRARRNAAARP